MTIVAEDDRIRIEKLELGPFGTNSYVVICMQTRSSAVVDAPGEASIVLDRLQNSTAKCILLTHGHMDHTGALAQLRTELEVPVGVHAADAGSLLPPPEMLLNDGDVVTLGRLQIAVLHVPGHTPGSLCFRIDRLLISGDTIFPGGPGRTNSPADFRQIVKSITEKILPLPEDIQIHPGHGPSTSLKKERESFALFASRPHDPGLCGDVLWLSG
jgi:hydroxyacylglutathione hydrolase